MGFAITWFAVPEERLPDLLQELRLTPTGETETIPESMIASARLTTGWAILWYGKYDCPFLGERELAAFSSRGEILRCLVEEHVMASSAELWAGGRKSWGVSHQGENGPNHLEVAGSPPPALDAIRAGLEEAQRAAGADAGVDHIFEIPLQVARTITGFKHDEECDGLRDGTFAVLARAAGGGGLLARLFGRKDR